MGTETVADIAQSVFLAQQAAIQANLDGCLEGKDPNHLHDLRVANRRLRAALIEFRELLPSPLQEKYLADFRWIHQITGEVRDQDVSLALIPDYLPRMARDWRQQLEPVIRHLQEIRAQSQNILQQDLGSERVKEILRSWKAYLEENAPFAGSLACESAQEYGSRQIVKCYLKIREKGSSLTKNSPPERFHAFRIAAKELRYLLEFYCSTREGEEFSRLKTGLKTLQDAFGALQDAGVLRTRLLQIAQELHRQGASTATLLASGQLLGAVEKSLRRLKKESLRQARWLISDPTARTFQSCFQYPVDQQLDL